MSFVAILTFASAAFCAALALIVVFREPRSAAHWSFAAGMLGLSAESTFSGLSLVNVGDLERMVYWQNLRLLAMSSLSGSWLLFSSTYSRGNCREFIERWRLALGAVLVIPLILAGALLERLITTIRHITPTGQDHLLGLGVPGLVINLIFLLCSVMILMNLERTFRASVGTMRWRIKYTVMGLGLLFAVRIYTSSQYQLFSGVSLSLEGLNAVALLLANLLVALSLRRAGHFNVDIYPSRALLHNSLALLLTGIYLLLVGVLAKVVTFLGGDAAFPLKAFLVLASLIGLTILLLSERVRQHTSRLVSRHLKRPHYDYRRVWLSFTRLTSSIMNGSTLCRAVAKWVSETFQVLSVNVWLVDDSREHLIYGASTSFPEAELEKRLKVQTGPMLEALRRRQYPFDVNETKEKCLDALKLHNPDAFRNGGCRVCVPMIASGEFLGLMIVGDRVNGIPFSTEDLDLLKCIGDQVAGDLLNIRLSESLLQAKEMEAFQTMSAFFVHDLKNTAFTLSLLLQNLPEHFDKPEFRGDMLRALAKCVSRINHLISRLGLLRHELELKRTEADLNDVVAKALASLGSLLQVQVTSHLRPIPNLSIDPEQIQKVINNLLVNAIEAVGKTGLVHVETSTRNGWIQLSVRDNGCGMSPEFVAGSLFRPFQTTKKRGIGIGMFLSKMIVDAHEGRVEVESHIGKGTTFHLLLPLQGASH